MMSWRPAPPWALALLVALLVVIALSYADLAPWALAGALLAPVVALASLARPLVSLGVCVLTAVATGLAIEHAVPPWSAALGAALAVISVLAGRQASRLTPVLAVFAVGVVLAVLLASTGLIVLAIAVVFPWFVGRSISQQAKLAAAAAERVQLQERARIAHDMHDTLGHELSLLALRAGALEMASDVDERHRAAVGQLRAGAGAATERLADIVALLRDNEPAPRHPVSDDIQDLVDRAREAGMAVSIEWDGRLPPMVQRTAHRVVQEGLTNAMKHAPGSTVQVRIVSAANTTVTVTNAVSAKPWRAAGGGVGLVALRERVRLAGGALQAGRDAGNFEIVATLPHAR
jgi:signal transduction histidine kinase